MQNYILGIFSFILLALVVVFSQKILLNILELLGYRQHIRESGPEHQHKAGTPTAGGLIFLVAVLYTFILNIFYWNNSEIIYFVLIISLGAGSIGYLDDYLKRVKHQNEGLKPKQKLILQLVLTCAIALYLNSQGTLITLFNLDYALYLPWPLYVIFLYLVLAGTLNSTNLTDGLDGLLSSLSVISLIGLAIFIYIFSPIDIIHKFQLINICLIMGGCIAGFYWINKKPAKVFMGDTGSFFIGGVFASIALIAQIEWLLFIIMAVPIIEIFSVIIQILSCKLSLKFLKRDIRPFLMTPLHHHFEKSNWTENNIVKRFCITQILIIIVYLALNI